MVVVVMGDGRGGGEVDEAAGCTIAGVCISRWAVSSRLVSPVSCGEQMPWSVVGWWWELSPVVVVEVGLSSSPLG